MFATTGDFIMGQLMIFISIYYPPLYLFFFLAKQVEDLSNLVILYHGLAKTDLNLTEMHDLHRYHFSRYLKGGIAIFEPFPIREWFPLL